MNYSGHPHTQQQQKYLFFNTGPPVVHKLLPSVFQCLDSIGQKHQQQQIYLHMNYSGHPHTQQQQQQHGTKEGVTRVILCFYWIGETESIFWIFFVYTVLSWIVLLFNFFFVFIIMAYLPLCEICPFRRLPWPENLANTCMRHTETLDSCFNLIRSHQPCVPWSPLEIKPVTTEYRAENLPLSHLSTSHTSDAKLTSHCNCAVN